MRTGAHECHLAAGVRSMHADHQLYPVVLFLQVALHVCHMSAQLVVV